ncbi:hypothetical protein D920_02649 [Enterococcus faecalis 13-SD-W-01]|nr:hypothetical protein D920_02649 [Enterococcus faecalis 13-SD-W-01]
MKKGLIVMVLAALFIGGFSQIASAADSGNSSKESSSVKKDEKKDKSSKKKKTSSKKSKSKKSSKKSTKAKKKKSTVDKSKLKYPDQKKIGEGTVSKKANVGLANGITKLRWVVREWDTTKPVFTYIDGQLADIRLMTDAAGNLPLIGMDWTLEKGKHYMEFVQYDNDKEDGNIVTYKTSYYKMD